MRVRATGSPRAHPLEVVGHGRRSPRIPKPVDGRPTWQVARCQACNTQSDEAQATAIRFWAFLLTVKRDTQKERTTKSRKSWGAKAVRVSSLLGFLVNSETRHTERLFGAFLLTVKRDTQKEQTTKSRKSWGAKAVRVDISDPRSSQEKIISLPKPRPRRPRSWKYRGNVLAYLFYRIMPGTTFFNCELVAWCLLSRETACSGSQPFHTELGLCWPWHVGLSRHARSSSTVS